jgi:hypothetical protein
MWSNSAGGAQCSAHIANNREAENAKCKSLHPEFPNPHKKVPKIASEGQRRSVAGFQLKEFWKADTMR